MKKILAVVILAPAVYAVAPIVLAVVAVVGGTLVCGCSILWALGEFIPGARKEFERLKADLLSY